MDTYKLQKDVKAFGFQVKSFPDGIGEAFDTLLKLFPPGETRSYYGYSEFAKDGSILYYALAEEKSEGEGKKLGYPVKTIEKGEYLAVTVKDWQKKTDKIKDVFDNMMKDKRAAKGKPCIEWYKTMDEMLCMLAVDQGKN